MGMRTPPHIPPSERETLLLPGRGSGWDADALDGAIERSLAYLARHQQSQSHWVGVLSSSALATAMSMVALHLVDAKRFKENIARGRHWLVRTQLDDGGWGDAMDDPANINATSLAYAALKLTEPEKLDPAEERAMRLAATRLDRFGGWATVGDPNRCTLSGPCRTVAALAGLMDWRRIKRLRPEVILIPRRLRRTISTTFPAYLSISMTHQAMAGSPLNMLPTYALARSRSLTWLARAQGPNGSFEESAFLTSVILMGMYCTGHGHLRWMPDAIAFVEHSQRPDGGWPIDRDLETFDTDMSVFAYFEAGAKVPHAEKVRDWLLERQFTALCFPTGAAPGGWAWAMPAGWPDCDDTSYTLMALRALGVPASANAVRKGAQWLAGMQSRTGAWPTFVRDSKMPFDHDCPYITGHVLSALQSAHWLDRHHTILERALTYLHSAQRHDGTFPSIWFRESVAGTASVLEALADMGLARKLMAQRSRDALLRLQNDDGGWAGNRLEGSTAEETSWAVLALLRCPETELITTAVDRGVHWLLRTQRPDGTWRQAPIGLYYSAMWYSDSYYALTPPLQALARARARFMDEYAE